MKKNIWKSLEIKMTVLFLSVVFLLSGISTFFHIDRHYSLAVEQMKEAAVSVHRFAENVIGRNSFLYLNTVEDENSRLYKDAQNRLNELRAISNILSLYTAKRDDDGNYVYVVDSVDSKYGEFHSLGTPVEDKLIPYIRRSLDDEIVLGDGLLHTERGVVYTAYFPFHDADGSVIGVIGMEFDCEDLHLSFRMTRMWAIILVFAFIAAAFGVSLMIIRTNVRKTKEIYNGIEELLKESVERASVMLDSSPVCAQIWDKNLNVLDCNEAAVKLYGFKDKMEYMRRFLTECSPEYQPDGQRSVDKALRYVTEAFENGFCAFEWTHQIPGDKTPIPSEVTLVRVKMQSDDVVVGYTRDLRGEQEMQEKIAHGNILLRAVNQAASLLFAAKENEDIETVLMNSMRLVALSIRADRSYIFRNETTDGELRFVCAYCWLNETSRRKNTVKKGMSFTYKDKPEWEEAFMRGEYISSPVKLSPVEQYRVFNRELKSIVMIPLFLDNQFWGFFSIDDCDNERVFSENEIGLLRSISLMMMNAINLHALVAKRIKELALQTATLNTVFDAMQDFVFSKDMDLRFTYCNEAFLKYLGKSPEEVIGKSERECLDFPEETINIREGKQRRSILEKDMLITEERDFLHNADGSARYFESTVIPLILNGEAVGVVNVSRDITERKEREAVMKSRYEYTKRLTRALSVITKSPTISEGNLKSAANIIARIGCFTLNVNAVGIWQVSDDGSHLKSITGFNSQSQKYEVQDDFDLISLPEYANLLKSERVISTSNYADSVKTFGEEYGKHLCAALDAPIRINGKLVGVVCVEQISCKDYPDGRGWTMEEQSFASSLADLMSLAISGYERQKARGEAQAANSAKSMFLANMSHEMRTPLNVIVGLTELLATGENPPEEAQNYIEKINTAGTTLTLLINDVLDISKIEAGKLSLFPVRYELAGLLNDIITISTVRISDKPITFILDAGDNLFAELYGDNLRVKQILINLLSNAFKYTAKGVVTLSVSCAREGENDVRLRFSVSDTGIGIREEDLKLLFVDYSQVNVYETRKEESTGLGLSIVKGLVTLMDGDISVESEYGKGSIFSVNISQGFVGERLIGKKTIENLRLFRYEDSKKTARRKTVRPDLSWAKVLVVDDAPTNLDVAKGMLGTYKMRVDCVTCGPDAIERIKSGEPAYDAIFMDHMMPGMDGIETAAHIRALGTEYARDIPIIALTANAVAGNEQLFLDEGFQAFISKPINVPKLDAVIRKWIMKEAECSETPPPAAPKQRKGKPAVEIQGVNARLGLSLYEGDMEIYLEILRSFVNNTPAELDKLREFSELSDEQSLPDYAINIHTLKGVSASIGAKEISTRAKEMEKMAKSGDYAGVAERNEQFIKDAETLVENIKTWLEKNGR